MKSRIIKDNVIVAPEAWANFYISAMLHSDCEMPTILQEILNKCKLSEEYLRFILDISIKHEWYESIVMIQKELSYRDMLNTKAIERFNL